MPYPTLRLLLVAPVVGLLIVLTAACGAPPTLASVAGDVAAHLDGVAPPLVDAHAQLVAVWAGPEPVWDAAWAAVIDDLAAATESVVDRFSRPDAPVRALLAGYPFLFEVGEGDGRWCVAPADASGARFEALEGPCADAGYAEEVLPDLAAELSQPELARGRALVALGYDLTERLAGAADAQAALAEFRAATGTDAAFTADGSAVEVRDGVLAVCVTVPTVSPDAPEVIAARPAPGPCPTT